MVNNAGLAVEGKKPLPVWDCEVETFDKTNIINSRGVFLGVKYASKQMVSQKPHPSGDRGWIINLASIFGLVAAKNTVAYATSKGSVVNMTKAAALDCADYRVHVNAIAPGFTGKKSIFVDHSKADPSDSVQHDRPHLLGPRHERRVGRRTSFPWSWPSNRPGQSCRVSRKR